MRTFQEFMEEKDPCWKGYQQVGTKKKGKKRVPNCVPVKEHSFQAYLECRDCSGKCEGKKPFKNFDPKKNHKEGGLSRAEAKRLGIHAGIEVKREIEKKGGVDKMGKKSAARRKSFCARMQGMKDKNTSSKTANDPDSKINAALRVWKC